MRCPPIHLLLLLLLLACPLARPGPAQSRTPGWKAGTARVVITPEGRQWLAGYGSRRPAEGKRHDVWVKVLALEDRSGRRAVLVTSDLVGVSRVMYDRLADRVQKNWGLGRERFMLTYSHNHCAPVTDDVLPDYYPLEPDDWEIVSAYSRRLEDQIVRGIGEAISQLSPATLSAGEGTTDFAVNRRNNREAEVPDLRARGIPLKGPVDHSVPVLAVHAAATGKLLAVAFGYACHPTTLGDGNWCGDYPGFAQIRLEQSNPGAVALFWTGCGGDQNPLPRRTAALCEQYGNRLAQAVQETLGRPLRPLEPRFRGAFDFVRLDFDRQPGLVELQREVNSNNSVRARWARRMIPLLEAGHRFPDHCRYGLLAWRLGDQLWIAMGGEAVVDYSLRFRREYGPTTWVCGYAQDMVGYVPSRRVWEEGGYEAEFIYEYGWLAYRWSGDVEERIGKTVARLVRRTR